MFVLEEAMDLEGQTGGRGVARSASLMQYLGAAGNKVALKRLMDIKQMCAHLNIAAFESTNETTQQATPGNEAGQMLREETRGVAGSSNHAEAPELGPGAGGYDAEDLGLMPLWGEDINFLSDFHGNELNLDGTVETDWGEFERTILQF